MRAPQPVSERVAARKVAMAGDPEAAHAAEDALWADVLAAIAGGHSNASLLAKEALKTSAIEFARWCAEPAPPHGEGDVM